MIARHPRLRFQCFLATRHANQSFCTLARELPNLSLAGYWWHNFFPARIRQVIAERLDMLPVNKQIGFFSDAYCVEWVYGKSRSVRKAIGARCWPARCGRGNTRATTPSPLPAPSSYETPQTLLGMTPRKVLA